MGDTDPGNQVIRMGCIDMEIHKTGPGENAGINWKLDKSGAPASSQSSRDLHKLVEKQKEENLEAWARFPNVKIGDPDKAQKLYQLMLETFGPPPSPDLVEQFLKENPAVARVRPTIFEAPQGDRTPEAPSAATRRRALALNNAFASVFETWPTPAKGKSLRGRAKTEEPSGATTAASSVLKRPSKPSKS
jgi:hypothetical protein